MLGLLTWLGGFMIGLTIGYWIGMCGGPRV